MSYSLMRRKERDRCITPVIDKSRRAILGIELKDGQQFHSGDPEFVKIGDLLNQSSIGAAGLLIGAELG